MTESKKYRIKQINKIKEDLFFERNKLLIILLAILFVEVMMLLHQTGIVVMVAG